MKILLDTNICIYIIKQRPLPVLEKFLTYQVGDIAVSAITVAELNFGVSKSKQKLKNQTALNQFLMPLTVLPWEPETALIYGDIRSTLEKNGTPIGSMDLLIAAHALYLNIPLVTNNIKEFSRIPNIELQNWVESI